MNKSRGQFVRHWRRALRPGPACRGRARPGQWPQQPAPERALAAKASADAAVVEKAAARTCAVNCRSLLEQHVATAVAEVDSARAELAAQRTAAVAELEAARAALAALPAPPSVSPLADRLGLEGWQVDLAAAALASLAANCVGAFLLAFAAHGRRQTHAPLQKVLGSGLSRNAAAEADAFARALFRPAPGGGIGIVDIRVAYDAWCRAHGLAPLPSPEIGAALAELFGSVGLYRRGSSAAAVIVGLGWAAAGQTARPRRRARAPWANASMQVVSGASPRAPRLGRMAEVGRMAD